MSKLMDGLGNLLEQARFRFVRKQKRVEDKRLAKELIERENQARREKDKIAQASSTFTCPVTGMEFVQVDGGVFQMGDVFGEGSYDESPVHEVELDDFYIGKYQVTQAEWVKIMEHNPSEFNGNNRNPV